MEMNEEELKQVLGGANPNAVNYPKKDDNELTEEELVNVLAGATDSNRDAFNEYAIKNPQLYREDRLDELESGRGR